MFQLDLIRIHCYVVLLARGMGMRRVMDSGHALRSPCISGETFINLNDVL